MSAYDFELNSFGDLVQGHEPKVQERVRANNETKPGYDNSGSDVDLHNPSMPNFEIQKETPEHRFLLYLFAQGNSTIEVFQHMGGQLTPNGKPIPGTGRWSYHWLCQIRRQSWFRNQLTAFLHEMGKDLVQAKLQTELLPSLEVVVEIRDDPDAPSATRLNAANSLIDRFLGKPTQRVVTESPKDLSTYETDVSVLQKQIEQVETEMKAFNAATVN